MVLSIAGSALRGRPCGGWATRRACGRGRRRLPWSRPPLSWCPHRCLSGPAGLRLPCSLDWDAMVVDLPAPTARRQEQRRCKERQGWRLDLANGGRDDVWGRPCYIRVLAKACPLSGCLKGRHGPGPGWVPVRTPTARRLVFLCRYHSDRQKKLNFSVGSMTPHRIINIFLSVSLFFCRFYGN